MTFKPILAGECTDIHKLRYPVMASPKLDGIRALVLNGVLVSRNLKPIPNVELQARYGQTTYEGLDGELIAGSPSHKDCFRTTTSIVMSRDKTATSVRFHAFDLTQQGEDAFERRIFALHRAINANDLGDVALVPHYLCRNADRLSRAEAAWLAKGYEGLMIRDPAGPYKQGRSTEREGWLLKLKRFADAEAEVVGLEEQMANNNTATTDNLGHTKRSTHKANMAGKGVLGALVCVGVNGPYKGVQFNVGTGFDDKTRADLWESHRDVAPLYGRVVKYKYFPSGSKDAPRFPTFLGFRDSKDM